ncbi:hypothetical protein B0I35DRAFT_476166 [Stachybotrys elegans]|uniref:DUF4139 domain-containing protein n=1 Tax=Stachybotrys elegans TaxID=80388 RepID=A0A8K0T1M8_9HYPO|nr:hypothetical protein B0I35DRAFT_476166 [Stachybotrys elegans]
MDNVNSIEYNIRDLSTRSVTLFPTRAQVFRDIKNVVLKPGSNQVTIRGLSPTVDEDSIKVEGLGAAVITNISVESAPNHEIFSEVYPDSDQEEEDDVEEDDKPKPPKESLKIASLMSRQEELNDKISQNDDAVRSAQERLRILDKFTSTLHSKHVDIATHLKIYEYERARATQGMLDAKAFGRRLFEQYQELSQEIADAEALHKKATRTERKEYEKALREQEREKKRKRHRKEERTQEKQRIKSRRQLFWPKYCYTVRIELEPYHAFSPASSRRGSFSSEKEYVKASQTESGESEAPSETTCHLVLSYVTASAYWSPSYDVQLSTPKASGSLCFDAMLRNSTSETWENCKISLSTSQTMISGLDDTVPELQPWRIKLVGKNSTGDGQDIVTSREEVESRRSFKNLMKPASQPKSRAAMFGIADTNNSAQGLQAAAIGPPVGHGGGPVSSLQLQSHQTQLMLLEQQNKKRLMMARQEQNSMRPPPQQQQMMQAQLQAQAQARAQAQAQTQYPQSMPVPASGPAPTTQNVLQDFDFDTFLHGDGNEPSGGNKAAIPGIEAEPLDFQNSLVEETGFTTSYDLPGLKTLAPMPVPSKQRIARVIFPNVVFSHTLVAKYKPVAYLRARMRNTSSLTLLQGPVGLTLDGGFMGRTMLPRCSAGDFFTLSLGTDPAIKVTYPKPDVRRSTAGLFTKENSSMYVRHIQVHNTRSATGGKPVNLLLLDQIPLSEDERLRVELAVPHGLAVDGSVPAGLPARPDGTDKDWGSAKAGLNKAGEVSWMVSLNAGKAVKLALEYSVSMPVGDVAMQCT